MVVPCLTCTKRESMKYEFDKERGFYNYHIVCTVRADLPDPIPKEGFECPQYAIKPKHMRIDRKQCDVEVNQ